MFSFAWRHSNPSTVVFIQYLFGLSLVDSIRSRPRYEHIDLRLKWPNDIYLGTDTKVGGILVSSSFEGKDFNLVIGCGLNVSNARPTTSLDEVLDAANLPRLAAEDILGAALRLFDRDYTLFVETGSFEPFRRRYYDRWIHSDQCVDVARSEAEGGGTLAVKIKGITDDGYLFATDESSGERVELEPDGNTFDMMRGLIKRKQ